MRTLSISQKLAKINEGNVLHKKIEELRKEEQVLIERTQPWQDEALQLCQVVDEKLQELQQRETTMVQKAIEHMTEALSDETCNKEKQFTEIL